MRCRTVKYVLPWVVLVALCGILGCDGGDGGGNLRPPVADISGTWEGPEGTNMEFTFVQSGNKVSGVSSLQGLARFSGTINGNVLTIEGTDIYAYISSDGKEIRGSYTSAGIAGQTTAFNLRRVADGGIKF